MRSVAVFAMLLLAGAAAAPPPAESSEPPELSLLGQTGRRVTSPYGGRYDIGVPLGAPDGRCACEVRGNALQRVGRDEVLHTTYAASHSGAATIAPRMPVWKQAGAYTLEFTGAAFGTLVAAAGGLATIEGVYQAGWNGPGSVPGAAAYCLTSAALSAGSTHLIGKLIGRGNSFGRALVGGAIGGFLGGVAFRDYFVTRRNPHSAMLPVGLLLPPLCTVIVYNVWRSDGAK